MAGPDLQSFIFRGQALQLYRKFLRTIRNAPPDTREELHRFIKQEFRNSAAANDAYAMKYRLSEGRTQLKQLGETLGMTAA
ncbi:hypothetical protein WJX73_003547 [Symbiochloris irregularis]|uniref:LYR motif-containing protein 2 n=1 Tax=Symbiochloris irregularis TaxID=706552 RepID=A0AAW1P098_9CHLO